MSDDPASTDEDDWSQPAIYGRGLVTIEPSTYVGADPIPAVLLPQWQQLTDDEQATWSQTTYGGRRRHRPRGGPVATITPQFDPDPMTTLIPPVSDSDDDDDAVDDGLIHDGPPWAEGSLLSEDVPPEPEPRPHGTIESDRKVLASSRTMAIASLVSRLTGFVRSLLLVAALGIADVSDAYNSANSFPNMVYELLLGGVLSSVLIPLIVNAQEHDRDRGEGYTQRLLAIATAALGVATLLAVAAAPLIAAAFVNAGPKRELTSILGTLLLPEILFYGLGALVVAVLNTRQIYGPGAWAPVLNNVVVIATIGIFWAMPGPATLTPSTITTSQILVIGIGTTLGIVAQALVLLPALRRTGFRWAWRFKARPEEVGRLREVGSLAGWVVGYVIASQIGLWVILRVANRIKGAATSFATADLLFQMPYGILGVSLLTALMPRMSRAASRQDIDGVKTDLALGARLSAVALLPITAGLMTLGGPIGEVLFSYGASTPEKARHVGLALSLSAFGLVPFALVMLQLRVFYAMRDARTPTIINIFMVSAKIVLVLISALTLSDSNVAIALNVSTSASYVIGAVVGHLLLTRRIGALHFGGFGMTVVRMGSVSIAGGLAALLVLTGVQAILGDGRLTAVLGLLLGSAVGVVVVFGLASKLRFPEITELRAAVRR